VACGSKPSTVEEFDAAIRRFPGSGFKRSPDGRTWLCVDSSGTTQVSTLLPAGKYITILFEPAVHSPVPATIMAVLSAKATSVTLFPPDKLAFNFSPDSEPTCKMEDAVVVTLKDGCWLETERTVTWTRP
jgi:hypothetical protein